MWLMALDTTTRGGSVALIRDDVVVLERVGDPEVSHVEQLPGAIGALLAEAGLTPTALDVLAVASGPGGFTGLRVGLAATQGLALALDRPAVGVPILAADRVVAPGAAHGCRRERRHLARCVSRRGVCCRLRMRGAFARRLAAHRTGPADSGIASHGRRDVAILVAPWRVHHRRGRTRIRGGRCGGRIRLSRGPARARGRRRPGRTSNPSAGRLRPSACAGAALRQTSGCRGRARTPSARRGAPSLMVRFGRLTAAADLDGLMALDDLCFRRPWTRVEYERELSGPGALLLVRRARGFRPNRGVSARSGGSSMRPISTTSPCTRSSAARAWDARSSTSPSAEAARLGAPARHAGGPQFEPGGDRALRVRGICQSGHPTRGTTPTRSRTPSSCGGGPLRRLEPGAWGC